MQAKVAVLLDMYVVLYSMHLILPKRMVGNGRLIRSATYPGYV